MTSIEKRQESWELELVTEELHQFHAKMDAEDIEAIDAIECDAEECSDAEVAYLFGRYENAEIVNAAYAQLDEQLF